MASNKDDWKPGPHFDEFLLQIQPGHSRHPDIQDQAATFAILILVEKVMGRRIEFAGLTYG